MNNAINDERIFKYRYRIVVQISKIAIMISIVIILASVIYSYYHYVLAKEWKIIFTCLEAKLVGLLTNKKEASYIIASLHIDEILTKFKYVLYFGLKLAAGLHLLIFCSMLFCLWLRQKIVNDSPYPQLIRSEINLQTKTSELSNKLKPSTKEETEEFIKIKNL